MSVMNIVLHEPEIPFNTGAIGRTCVATGSALHLIKPYGFILNDRNLKKAGMDYWPRLRLSEYLDYRDFLERNHIKDCVREKPGGSAVHTPRLWLATTKGGRSYSEVLFGAEDYIMFGKESGGIPREILEGNPDACIRIPMFPEERSLNLSNSVSIILFEALRQNGFPGLV